MNGNSIRVNIPTGLGGNKAYSPNYPSIAVPVQRQLLGAQNPSASEALTLNMAHRSENAHNAEIGHAYSTITDNSTGHRGYDIDAYGNVIPPLHGLKAGPSDYMRVMTMQCQSYLESMGPGVVELSRRMRDPFGAFFSDHDNLCRRYILNKGRARIARHMGYRDWTSFRRNNSNDECKRLLKTNAGKLPDRHGNKSRLLDIVRNEATLEMLFGVDPPLRLNGFEQFIYSDFGIQDMYEALITAGEGERVQLSAIFSFAYKMPV
ncbi:hypothetical protein BD410DRAFT_787897 [Rickenella mellea]|uniref:Uncharacterized protein n=1 Tax=Rickenella mellea TaxID=50990 RepID=A0A4Y7Q840_9AGAM|nr:hypothetical protein BD410DRAFT_787897 [Rickenella mellea]